MSSNFNLNLLAETQPSICIPRVFNNIAEKKIRQVFDELNLGKISRIDIKERKNEKGEVFNRVYIHFEKWFWNEDAQTARRKLILGKEIKIIYDKPWFWKVSASKWEPPKRCDNLSQKQVKSSSVYIKFDDEDDEFGRELHLSDLKTDEFGRELRLSDLKTDEFGRELHLSDLNISHEFKRDLSLGNSHDLSLGISTEFGRDLSLSDLNISTDEFGRDLSLKRDYEERRRIERINNFRPINRRLNDRRTNDRRTNDRRTNDRRTNDRRTNDRRTNDRRTNDRRTEEPVVEPEEEIKIRPFASVSEDVDNLNIPKFEIDYGTPLIVPKINRKIIKKKITVSVPKPKINWYEENDTDTDDDEENDTDVFLTEVFNKISINDIRPRSPDYPPPKNQEQEKEEKEEEEEEFDLYADLEI